MKMKKMIKNSRAQQETVGFVLIIIIVAIIGLALLWFFLRSPSKPTNSVKVSNLLSASMYYTSNCSVTYIPNYKTGQDLVKHCYTTPSEKCDDGRTFCEALNHTFESIIEGSLKVGEDVPIKGYKLRMYFDQVGTEESVNEFFNVIKGRFANCTTRYAGTHSIFLGTGNIEVKLEVCERNVKKN